MSATDAPAPPTRRRPSPRWVAAGATAVAAMVAVIAAAVVTGDGRALDTAVLGVVEGVTEFLPVSSTGHLIVTERLLGATGGGADKEAADAFAVAIQAGAIVAVMALYRRRVAAAAAGLLGRDEAGRRLLINLVVAFAPAAVIGLALEDTIKEHLFGPGPVMVALAVGGVAILVLGRRWDGGRLGVDDLAVRAALVIGTAQVVAMWPGVSRSLVTILAGMAVGLSAVAAVEFSFLLGLVTLGAATGYQMLSDGALVLDHYGAGAVAVGFATALVSALVAVRWMVGYLDRHGLHVFGWYRLGAAGVLGALMLTGVL